MLSRQYPFSWPRWYEAGSSSTISARRAASIRTSASVNASRPIRPGNIALRCARWLRSLQTPRRITVFPDRSSYQFTSAASCFGCIQRWAGRAQRISARVKSRHSRQPQTCPFRARTGLRRCQNRKGSSAKLEPFDQPGSNVGFRETSILRLRARPSRSAHCDCWKWACGFGAFPLDAWPASLAVYWPQMRAWRTRHA